MNKAHLLQGSRLKYKAERSKGFSLIELVIVLVIILILGAFTLPNIFNYKSKYKSEDQAHLVMDTIRETSQSAMNQRRTFRFEIDLTDNSLKIIDENNGDPDTLVRAVRLETVNEVRLDTIPASVERPNPPNYNEIAFSADAAGHFVGGVQTIGNNVWAARFRSDGSVVNAANNPISASIFVFPPETTGSTTARSPLEIRAITLFGGSGAIRFWKYDGTAFKAY